MDLERGRVVQVPLAADEGMDLAQPTRFRAGQQDPRGAARVKEWMRLGLELHLDAELRDQRLQHALERKEVVRLRIGAPAGLTDRAHAEGGETVRLEGGCRSLAGELAAERAARARLPLGQIDATGLE